MTEEDKCPNCGSKELDKEGEERCVDCGVIILRPKPQTILMSTWEFVE